MLQNRIGQWVTVAGNASADRAYPKVIKGAVEYTWKIGTAREQHLTDKQAVTINEPARQQLPLGSSDTHVVELEDPRLS